MAGAGLIGFNLTLEILFTDRRQRFGKRFRDRDQVSISHLRFFSLIVEASLCIICASLRFNLTLEILFTDRQGSPHLRLDSRSMFQSHT